MSNYFGCVIYYAIFGQLFLAALYITLYLGNYFWLRYILCYILAIIFGCVIYNAIFGQLFLTALYIMLYFGQLFLAALYITLYLGNYFRLHYILPYIRETIFGCVIFYTIFGQLFLAALYITLYLGNFFWLRYILGYIWAIIFRGQYSFLKWSFLARPKYPIFISSESQTQ